jgi:hypothetical protein
MNNMNLLFNYLQIKQNNYEIELGAICIGDCILTGRL